MRASGLAGGAALAAVSADWLVEGPPPSKRNEPTTRKATPPANSRACGAQTRFGERPEGLREAEFSLTGRGSTAMVSVAVGGLRLARGSEPCAGADQEILGVLGRFL
jgi:hypothetical protein